MPKLEKLNKSKERESGIELLRIVAMILIVSHHMVYHNVFPVMAQTISARRLFLQQFMCVPGKVGVALFFMISAWFMADREPTLKKVLRKMWILERELLFWSLLICMFQIANNPNSITLDTILDALFPMSRNLWWYATSYAVFLLLSPFLFQGLRAIGKHGHFQCCLAMIFVWGVLYSIPGANTNLANVVAFIYVFVLISYYKWHMKPVNTKTAWLMFLSGALFSLLWNISITIGLQGRYFESEILAMFEREWTIPLLLISFGLFLIFQKMHFQSVVINRCAAATFGVYLITDHVYIRNLLWTHYFDLSRIYYSHSCLGVCIIFCFIVLGVFVMAMMLDMLRSIFFKLTIDRNKGRWFDILWSSLERFSSERKEKN